MTDTISSIQRYRRMYTKIQASYATIANLSPSRISLTGYRKLQRCGSTGHVEILPPINPFCCWSSWKWRKRVKSRAVKLSLSPDLAFRFSVFWSVVARRRKQPPEVRLPFHHLESSGIWQPLTADGKPSPDKKLTARIRLDPNFFESLADYKFRDQARRILIETEPYFQPEEKVALYSMLQIKPAAPEIREDKELYKASVQAGRDARFRIDGGRSCLQTHLCAYRLSDDYPGNGKHRGCSPYPPIP